jgi:UDP-N-acetylglucosamine--N-acetylmuramyl-(pentapeptide) pyrophosphoryl-undecaprenol N-acetylglucosamine transferase
MRVLIAGGGTAGHVFPALALARRLAASHGAEVHFAGTAGGQEATLVPEAGFPFTTVEARPLLRKVSVRALSAPMSALASVVGCRPLVEGSDVVVGMGGYVSVPVAVAAIQARRPLVLHEQNAVPGLANRALARAARTVALSFAEAERMFPRSARTILTGNPVREPILAVPSEREVLAKEAREELGLDADRKTVLVVGGSQGALNLCRATVDALDRLGHRRDLQILLLTGNAHLEAVTRSLVPGREPIVRAFPFLDRMELAYAVADLVVARAGATTIAELTVCGLPSMLIPYPYATGRHQEANARALQRAGAATIVMDEALTGELLAARITDLMDDPDRLGRMAARSRTWGRPDAAETLAEAVLEAARR